MKPGRGESETGIGRGEPGPGQGNRDREQRRDGGGGQPRGAGARSGVRAHACAGACVCTWERSRVHLRPRAPVRVSECPSVRVSVRVSACPCACPSVRVSRGPLAHPGAPHARVRAHLSARPWVRTCASAWAPLPPPPGTRGPLWGHPGGDKPWERRRRGCPGGVPPPRHCPQPPPSFWGSPLRAGLRGGLHPPQSLEGGGPLLCPTPPRASVSPRPPWERAGDPPRGSGAALGGC